MWSSSGGGLAGLSLACALRDTRLKIALVESRAPARATGWDARVYAINPANADFLREIGAWKPSRQRAAWPRSTP